MTTFIASEPFSRFLTALRETGVEIPLSDKACAELVAGALEMSVGDYGNKLVDNTAENIALEMRQLIECDAFTSDNGLTGEEEDEQE